LIAKLKHSLPTPLVKRTGKRFPADHCRITHQLDKLIAAQIGYGIILTHPSLQFIGKNRRRHGRQ
jgi:hypothetical protein